MSIYQIKDFSDIYGSVLEELKIQSTDTVNLNRIKRIINEIYLDEVSAYKRWWWLTGHLDSELKAYYGTGTCSVTPASTTVTLSIAPGAADGSKTGYLFAVDGFDEIYVIDSHTAESTTVTLKSPYTGVVNSIATFKIWTDQVALPTDCRETNEVWHDYYKSPMEGRGLQDFRRISNENPRMQARPGYYSTYDFVDPTPLTAETEADRYRVLKVYPAIYTSSTTLHIDYTKEVTPLELAGDEPILPIEDRSVLKYGALSIAWASIGRNPEEAARNRQLFEAKLARMAGKIQDSLEKPQIVPESTYLSRKRGPRMKSMSRRMGEGGGGGSYAMPTYLQNVTINGMTLTGNMTVNSGITIDGVDVSVLNSDFSAHLVDAVDAHDASAVSVIAQNGISSTDVQSALEEVAASVTSINSLANGKIYVGDGSNLAAEVNMSGDATITSAGVVAIASGVIVNADINASAAIAKTKLATGTASRVEVTDGSGNLTESAITATELTYLDDVEALTSATLTDNTTVTVASWTLASFDTIHLVYSLKRGSANKASGRISICTDGTNTAIDESGTSVGTLGVTFTVDISGGLLRLRATQTSTGIDATMQYKVNKWLA